jgi:hypothetical protein
MPIAQDLWTIQEDALYALLSNAMTPGGVLAVQPNPDGTFGIKSIVRSAPPESAALPNIGLMWTDGDEAPFSAPKNDATNRFVIMVSVQLKHDPATTELGEAALQYLRTYQNDNAGNGLGPLLRANVTLLGTASRSRIAHQERHVMVSKDESSLIAVALYTFETNALIQF